MRNDDVVGGCANAVVMMTMTILVMPVMNIRVMLRGDYNDNALDVMG